MMATSSSKSALSAFKVFFSLNMFIQQGFQGPVNFFYKGIWKKMCSYLTNIAVTNSNNPRGHVVPPTCCTRASRAPGNQRATTQRRELICIITFCRLQKVPMEGVSFPSRCSFCNVNCTQFSIIMLRAPKVQVLFKSRAIRLAPAWRSTSDTRLASVVSSQLIDVRFDF